MRHFIFFFLAILAMTAQGQTAYFFPEGEKFDHSIQRPAEFLGYEIGQRHTRHDRLVAYFEYLAEVSPKAEIRIIGYTYEHRPQVVLTVSDPANLARLEEIRKQHLRIAEPKEPMPDAARESVIVLMGYGVHGNEASSAEAAMLTAWWLVASQSPQVADYLKNAVVHIDPVYNPDGRDRHTHWANMHLGTPPVADPLDREHNEVWPGGRTNHYWFDLNRDWLPLAHVESRIRVDFYHQWLPNVATDYHEMGTNATYFFEPTEPFGSENPLVPRRNYDELNNLFAQYYRDALDDIGSLYYTRESYDNSYPGYGSTYPDIQGGLGLLFEQASSRGHLQSTSTEDLSFAFTIRNQLRTSMATIQAAVENRQRLLEYQRWFFETALEEAKKSTVKGWVFDDWQDPTRMRAFLDLLRHHRIEAYRLAEDFTEGNKTWKAERAFVVPAAQKQWRMAMSFFEPRTNEDIPDSVFYDASAWTVALAFDLDYHRLRQLPKLGRSLTEDDVARPLVPVRESGYAWLIPWEDYAAPGALYFLLRNGVHVKTAFASFNAQTRLGKRNFGRGTLLVSVADQALSKKDLHELMQQAHEQHGVQIYAVDSGRSLEGIDLGSRQFETVQMPKALMIVGEGVSGYEAGEVWHLLDTRVGMPITKVDVNDLRRLNLWNYNTLVLVSGRYNLSDRQLSQLREWLAAGNTLITIRQATRWAIEKNLVDEKLVEQPKDNAGPTKRMDFETAREVTGSKRIGGVVFVADADITHPLAFGLKDRQLPIYRNHEIFIRPSENPFSTVVAYTDQPQVDGYVHPDNLPLVKNSASLLVSGVGRGRVILFVDNPNFRGFWYGTNRLFFNALFFGGLVEVPG
ncbi:MAG: zinc carboxypeptidase [Saprospirales bacterium]|nr:zinc carboxypeptidase [Saprospirales bacterium]